MCGICGSTSDPEQRAVLTMCQALRHRGPDDEGTYLSPSGDIALGARRLSIIDLEDGHQPRGNEDGSIWTVFNGEIYNHAIFRERLRSRGHRLRGRSDTEILPHLYEDYGEDLVHVLDGMFAMAIWDSRRQRLLLARDRFGEKPLFYARKGKGLVFASELTALIEGLGSKPDVDAAALDAFFVLGYVPGSSGSILEGIRQLPPGHLLIWERDSGRIEERPYWSPPAAVTRLGESPRELAAEAGRLLRRSIKGRLMADVPLGVFLSGGLDSTVITALAAEQSKPLKTFTVGYRGGGIHDERSDSRTMASLIGSEHRDMVLSSDEAAARIPTLLSSLDQPLADAAIVPLHSVAEFARGEVTVAVGGEGADELFGGYPRYTWLGRAPQARRLDERAAAISRLVPRARSTSSRLRRALDLAVPRPIAERHLDWVTAGRRHLRPGLYGPRLRGALSGDRVLAELSRDLRESRSYSVAGSLMRLDQLHWLPDDVLVKADRAGMLASLELRTPYLQRELAEFATSVAPDIHLAGGGKQLLRLLLKEVLPEAPRRRKVAFLPPVAAWLRGALGTVMEAQLDRGALYGEGWIQRDVAARLLREHRDGRADHSDALWPLLAAGLWLDRYRGVESD
jgi:asparagine synthase (glutamine-hydrolysing)